jgi:hypothetical protein
MTDETEARLRAALHAYAEQVDDPVADLPRAPASGRAGAVRRWRGALLVAAAVAAVLGGAWWIGAGNPGGDVVAGTGVDQPSPESAAAPTSRGPEADAAVPASGLPAVPEVGVPYAWDLYTHCGVLGTDIGGTWFAADPPLVQEYGPPPGWGNPDQPGTLTLTAPDEAVFTDDLAHEVKLRAAPDSARPPLCG